LNYLISCFLIFFSLAGCHKAKKPLFPFLFSPEAVAIQPGLIDEASGIIDSKINPGCLWVEQDSGNPPDLYLLQHNGNLLKHINIYGAQNRDWEDISMGPGPVPGLDYLYIADIGDNLKQYTSYTIYRFPEPSSRLDTVTNYDKIIFQYPDNAHDAEALFIDQETKDIYIISKREDSSGIYKIAYPYSTTGINNAVFLTKLPFTGTVSAAISINTKEIIIKTYVDLFYWKIKTGETIENTLKKAPLKWQSAFEPQGEAICFRNDNAGFFTLSERGNAASVSLNFYKRQ